MNTNKIAIYTTVIFSVLLIGCGTFYKVVKNNSSKLRLVTNKKVIEAAKACYIDGVCKNLKVTLEELYNNNYLKENVIDPVKKRVYNNSSYVIISRKESTFYPN